MRKSPNAPRRLYVRKSGPCVCFAGELFTPIGGETELVGSLDVVCKPTDNVTKITVTQRKPHAKGLTETWRRVSR